MAKPGPGTKDKDLVGIGKSISVFDSTPGDAKPVEKPDLVQSQPGQQKPGLVPVFVYDRRRGDWVPASPAMSSAVNLQIITVINDPRHPELSSFVIDLPKGDESLWGEKGNQRRFDYDPVLKLFKETPILLSGQRLPEFGHTNWPKWRDFLGPQGRLELARLRALEYYGKTNPYLAVGGLRPGEEGQWLVGVNEGVDRYLGHRSGQALGALMAPEETKQHLIRSTAVSTFWALEGLGDLAEAAIGITRGNSRPAERLASQGRAEYRKATDALAEQMAKILDERDPRLKGQAAGMLIGMMLEQKLIGSAMEKLAVAAGKGKTAFFRAVDDALNEARKRGATEEALAAAEKEMKGAWELGTEQERLERLAKILYSESGSTWKAAQAELETVSQQLAKLREAQAQNAKLQQGFISVPTSWAADLEAEAQALQARVKALTERRNALVGAEIDRLRQTMETNKGIGGGIHNDKLQSQIAELEKVVAPAAGARVPPTTVPGVAANRVAHFNRAGYQNYRLETNVGTPENPVWRVHYHGYIAPGETAAAITRRHAGTVGPDGLARFNPATDRIVMEPGTRLYGEARLMEHRRIAQDGTNIGRVDVSGSRRGNNQGGLDPAKLREYEAWEQALHGR
jgi:hypothetical protein